MNRHSRLMIAGLALMAVAAAACSSEDQSIAKAGDFGHLHDIVRGTGGQLLVATHSGLYRIDDDRTAVAVGEERHDLMSMTADSNGILLASGHPDLRRAEWLVDGKPPLMGLATSPDDGKSWASESELGDADFHAIVVHADNSLTAADSSGRIMTTDDGQTWLTTGELEAFDLTANPLDRNELLATDYDNRLHHSTDRGRTWQRIAAPPLAVVAWTDDGILAVGPDGEVQVAADSTDPFTQIGTSPPGVEALLVEGQDVWVGVKGRILYRSSNRGETFAVAYQART